MCVHIMYATQLLWKAQNGHISKNVTQRNRLLTLHKYFT